MQPFDLDGVTGKQPWEWLFDLPQRLNVVIEVIDAQRVPVFPVGPTPPAAALRQALTRGEASFLSAVSEAVRSNAPARVTLDGLHVLCFGLPEAGALVVARQRTAAESANESAEEGWRDLEVIGSWLRGAIETSLTAPPNAISVEPYRIASLRRILSEATRRGAVRKVVGAFVEALGVWDGVRVRTYVAGANGGFRQFVSPVGASAASVPAELAGAAVPPDHRMIRVSRAEVDRLGFGAEPGDVLMVRIVTDAEVPWLLVFSGAIDGHEQVRLTLYSDMLRESLNGVLATMTSRAVAAMPQGELEPTQPMEPAAEAALAHLIGVVGGREAALVTATADGRQTLAVGDTDLLSSLDQQGRHDRLIVTSPDASSVMTLVVARDQPPFAAFERAVVQAAASALHRWVQTRLERSKDSERRRRFRPVDTLFDQLAASAIDAGQPASVIVVSVDAAASRPGLMQTWVGRIRAELRGGDFAGILSNNEIAVLLCDTSADQAAAVSSRLRQLMESDEGADAVLKPAFWIKTRSPEAAFDGSLVGAARSGAR